ncbi:MAG: 30S ribosomal protein S8 [Deltaproteobacteria bacterium GWC2_56_8]|nr:MAG: 30S ribosomal protein S8 [Deltaproteobacteria bacterium GWB2_55_19]OGP32851.1 MAG: 30S ribosomal protein S8 [Deltaproteobacteria bacterium GWC2_56_8]HAO92887.1 30S ribosomal protein S8 [Deltaproteobacteria bacterium]
MSMTDPIADMLTRIRNAIQARQSDFTMQLSNVKLAIARILKEEGYIRDCGTVKSDGRMVLKISLKYTPAKKNSISAIKRVSKPGLRKYVGKEDVPKVLNGLGIAIISTSRGLMTDRKARELGVGGEVVCTVY